MSTEEFRSGQPTRGKEETDPRGSSGEKNLPPVARDEKEEEVEFRQRRASPALRLCAWIFALVIVLAIFGLALREIL